MGEATAAIDIYDHEIPQIEMVCRKLNRKVGELDDYERFRHEAEERFAAIGLLVAITFEQTIVERIAVWEPTITIVGRIDATHEFDYDRQVHEVTHDLLDLGEGGVITERGIIKEPAVHTFFPKETKG